MIVQVLTVILNAVLAPVLIAGWVTGHPLGVAGAGLASSLAVAVGVILLWLYFHRLEKYVAFDSAAWRPRFATWGRLLRMIPAFWLAAGPEFQLVQLWYVSVASWVRWDSSSTACGMPRGRPSP
jgi:Na+-driven multidrug efflux pump